MAKHLGPKGVHVGYVIVDGVISTPATRARMGDKPEDFFLRPEPIADAVYFLAHQERSAWTFELDLRPFGEGWQSSWCGPCQLQHTSFKARS
jgi:hypothetical protein